MKNLSDIAVRMSDNVGTQDPSLSPELIKLHSGVNFLPMDIDDAATLVRSLSIIFFDVLNSPCSISVPDYFDG
jgi:hypothetical protein